MEKESFSIDDIINETKKRKEEERLQKLNEESAAPAEEPKEVQPQEEPKPEPVKEEPAAEEVKEAEEFSIKVKNGEAEEKAEHKEPEFSVKEEEPEVEEAQEVIPPEAPEEELEAINNTEAVVTDTAESAEDKSNGMVDLFALGTAEADNEVETVQNQIPQNMNNNGNRQPRRPNAPAPRNQAPLPRPEEPRDEKPKKKGKSKGEKITIGVIIALVVAIIIAVVVFVVLPFINMSDHVERDDGPISAEWTGMKDDYRNFPAIEETDAAELSSLQDMIKTWYKNGDPCSASHVLNVLLIGEDTRGTDIIEEETRADSAIIVSVNIDTETVTMTSILRDAYAYWQVEPGNEETGDYGKINASMAMENCSIETYISTIEHLYKIDIDNYVIVNFDCFATIIDELGGITLTMTAAEINEINNDPYTYGDIGEVYIEKTFEGNEGEVEVDGKQALAYCRIRHLDSDNMRAERQKKCLNQMFLKVKDSSNAELLKLATELFPYVKTGFSTKEVTSIAKYALSNGWKEFRIQSATVPYNRINENGAGGVYYGAWCWKADYPADAYFLQTLLYGETNITLAQNRVDILTCKEKGYYTDGVSSVLASGNSIYNLNYGMPTTYDVDVFNEEEEESTTIG